MTIGTDYSFANLNLNQLVSLDYIVISNEISQLPRTLKKLTLHAQGIRGIDAMANYSWPPVIEDISFVFDKKSIKSTKFSKELSLNCLSQLKILRKLSIKVSEFKEKITVKLPQIDNLTHLILDGNFLYLAPETS